MTMEWVLESMSLPERAAVNRRIPKKLIAENGARSAADRRLIKEDVERTDWVAALKPSTVGIAAARDDDGVIEEIAVITVVCRSNIKRERLAEIIHRAIPYPVVLLIEMPDDVMLSLAEKRMSRTDADQTVLEGVAIEVTIREDVDEVVQAEFAEALAINRQLHSDLQALYWYWMNVAIGLRAYAITKVFRVADTHEGGIQQWQAVRSYEQLSAEIASIGRTASDETQIARQVELNLNLQRIREQRDAMLESL